MLSGRIQLKVREMEAIFICGEELWSWEFGKGHLHYAEKT
jgi:hypothetical protein